MTLIRIALGILFLFSGISKLFSMESFELYIYSMGIAGFDLCSLAARLVIIFEIVVGLCYVAGIYRRTVNWLSMGSLLLFSGFLAWRLILGDDRSCHCMGDVVDLSPFDSLIKNGLLLIFVIRLAVQYRNDAVILKRRAASGPCAVTGASVCTCGCSGPAPSRRTALDEFLDRYRKIFLSVFVVAPAITVFAVTPPDAFLRIGHDSCDFAPESFAAHASGMGLDQGRKLVCFFSTSCEHCQHCAGKIAGVIDRHGISLEDVRVIFMQTVENEEKLAEEFFEEYGHGLQLPFSVLHPYDFLPLTNGSMPLAVLLENGKLVKEYDYISLNENEIADFFGK